MFLPASHCANCFKEKPEKHFAHTTIVKLGVRQYTHKMDVPLCQDCYKRVRIGQLLKRVAIVVCVGLVMLSLISMINTDISPVLAIVWALAGTLIAIILPPYLINRAMKIDYASVAINFKENRADVTFRNPDYQRLYEGANVLLARQQFIQDRVGKGR